MRPRRKILLYNPNPDQAGIMAYALRQQPLYSITVCTTQSQVDAELIAEIFEGAILMKASSVTVDTFRAVQPWCKLLAIGSLTPGELDVDMQLPAVTSMFAVLEELKFLTRRKRGPRKDVKSARLAREIAAA